MKQRKKRNVNRETERQRDRTLERESERVSFNGCNVPILMGWKKSMGKLIYRCPITMEHKIQVLFFIFFNNKYIRNLFR